MSIAFDAITLFPEMFAAVTQYGITRRAMERGLYSLECWNPRDFAVDNYRTVDDRPYGGGPGMVMMAGPLESAIDAALGRQRATLRSAGPVIFLSAQGEPLTHRCVLKLLRQEGLILVCGRYEGIDQRIVDMRADQELSLGDYVLSGGELAAMALIDAIVRQLPGALGDACSVVEESFAHGLLDFPHYTRPEEYKGSHVPSVLLSGHHESIRRWRLKESLLRTWRRRPDLLLRRSMSAEELNMLDEIKQHCAQERSGE